MSAQFSLFTRDPFKGRDSKGRPRWAFNPFMQIGKLEIALDRHGGLISWGFNYRRADWPWA